MGSWLAVKGTISVLILYDGTGGRGCFSVTQIKRESFLTYHQTWNLKLIKINTKTKRPWLTGMTQSRTSRHCHVDCVLVLCVSLFCKSALIIINVFLYSGQISVPWEYYIFVKYSTTGHIPTVEYHLSQHNAQIYLATTQYRRGNCPNKMVLKKGSERGGLSWCKKKGICRKVQDRSYVTGIRVILLSPSTPIYPLRWCMKIHLCYKPGAKTTQRKRERDTKDGLKDRCIYTGCVWPKPDHWESQISQ